MFYTKLPEVISVGKKESYNENISKALCFNIRFLFVEIFFKHCSNVPFLNYQTATSSFIINKQQWIHKYKHTKITHLFLYSLFLCICTVINNKITMCCICFSVLFFPPTLNCDLYVPTQMVNSVTSCTLVVH